jgi:hypothetical protein
MEAVYARPLLCRLCRYPAPDGSVRVSKIDREKLQRWCLRLLDTELDEVGLDNAVFCDFCLWDAVYVYIETYFFSDFIFANYSLDWRVKILTEKTGGQISRR